MAFIRLTEQNNTRTPWSEFERIRRGLEELSQTLIKEGKAHLNVYPPLRVIETDDSLVIMAELPGVKAEDLDISIEGDTLTLQGKRKPTWSQENNNKRSFHRREIGTGTFNRAITLPVKIDPDNIQAKLTDGILKVSIAKAEEVKPKKITITTE